MKSLGTGLDSTVLVMYLRLNENVFPKVIFLLILNYVDLKNCRFVRKINEADGGLWCVQNRNQLNTRILFPFFCSQIECFRYFVRQLLPIVHFIMEKN